MSALFRRFEEAEHPGEVGGKAHSLARMRKLSIPVPEGFIVTNAAFQAFLAQDGLGEHIHWLQAGLRRRRSRVRAIHLAELLAESHDNQEAP